MWNWSDDTKAHFYTPQPIFIMAQESGACPRRAPLGAPLGAQRARPARTAPFPARLGAPYLAQGNVLCWVLCFALLPCRTGSEYTQSRVALPPPAGAVRRHRRRRGTRLCEPRGAAISCPGKRPPGQLGPAFAAAGVGGTAVFRARRPQNERHSRPTPLTRVAALLPAPACRTLQTKLSSPASTPSRRRTRSSRAVRTLPSPSLLATALTRAPTFFSRSSHGKHPAPSRPSTRRSRHRSLPSSAHVAPPLSASYMPFCSGQRPQGRARCHREAPR